MDKIGRITMDYTKTLARWATGVDGFVIGDDVLAKSAEFVLDWAGAALAGSVRPQAGMLYGIVRENAPPIGPCTILNGSLDRTSELWAAFQNGFNGHIMEMDDVHRGAVFHPGTVVIPATLAVGQKLGVDGRKFLTSIAVGYEVGIRVGTAAGATHYTRWHTTGTCATFGACAAVGYLLGLTPEQMAWALGNAGSQAAGLWQFLDDGAMTKPLHSGKAAMNGLLAALAAKNGFTGPDNILEGRKGFLAATSLDAKPSALTEGLGERWQLMDVSIKPYASCRHSHPQIDVALEISRKDGFRPEEVSAVKIRTYRTAKDVAGGFGRYPKASHEAKFDSAYCVATALARGKVHIEDFEASNIESATDVKKLWEKTTISIDESLEAEYPAKWGAVIEARMDDRRVLTASTLYAKGDPEKPVTVNELSEKFKDLADGVLPTDELDALADRILGIAETEDIDTIFPT
ncbi:MAG TPA: MmgE/PrpD family protein [Bacillota bacterium]|nr:MmgE/PrpD family protein [Bacillota bacterium]